MIAAATASAPANQPALLLANPAVMVVAPLVFPDAGYDAERDFRAVSHVNSYEFGVAVGSAVPVKELPHLLAWLRANPEKANFGVPATGSLPHFFGLMVGDAAQVRAEIVGYRGSAPLTTDLVGGQVPVAFDTLDSLLPQHDAGKVRILAVSSAKRSPLAPNVPTFKEAGLDLVATGWNTFFAPASMPAAQVERLSLGKLRGQVYMAAGIPVVVTYHPAYLLRNPADKAKVWDDLCLAMQHAHHNPLAQHPPP